MRIWLNLANVMFFPPITDQFLHICALFSTNLTKYSPSWRLKIIVKSIYTNDFTVIHVTFEKRKRMKTLNCILSAMAIIACS